MNSTDSKESMHSMDFLESIHGIHHGHHGFHGVYIKQWIPWLSGNLWTPQIPWTPWNGWNGSWIPWDPWTHGIIYDIQCDFIGFHGILVNLKSGRVCIKLDPQEPDPEWAQPTKPRTFSGSKYLLLVILSDIAPREAQSMDLRSFGSS